LDRLFLDANVLFSAAWRENSRLLRLWKVHGVTLVSSAYAVEEARRNLGDSEARARLKTLIDETTIVAEGSLATRPPSLSLAAKDRPILAAAVNAGATHLITGDRRDFGKLFGRRIGGVLIQRPADYFKSRQR
jgi:predicted nucleic acid-binding protein